VVGLTSFFVCGHPGIPALVVEETILVNGVGTLVKNKLTIDVWGYFWIFQFYPISLYVFLYASTTSF
jgi:hypothetical protein